MRVNHKEARKKFWVSGEIRAHGPLHPALPSTLGLENPVRLSLEERRSLSYFDFIFGEDQEHVQKLINNS